MSLPHIQNSEAGRNLYDAVWKSLFEVYFTIPDLLRPEFGQDEAIITEHITKISGLDKLTTGVESATQTFMGTTRTFLKPKLDNTSYEISVSLTLNLRNKIDNYIFKLFRAWAKLGYDINSGATHLKKDYTAQWMKIAIGNPAGDVYREVIFKDVIMNGGVTGWDDLDYSSNEPVEIEVKFISDWALDSHA